MTTTMGDDSTQLGPYERLARYVRARREELGMTQNEVQMAGGPSAAAVRYIEAAKPTRPTARTIHALERALCWEPGSIDAILDGGEPTIAETASEPSTENVDSSVRALADLVAQFQQVMEQARATTAPTAGVSGETMDTARILAAREGRTVAEVMADAITLYSEVMGGDR